MTEAQQKTLNELTEAIVDLEEQIELAEEESTYKPAPGTENLIHVSIVRGRRYNPDTGKEESVPYIQTFNLSEYNSFKKNAALLGYTIISELYNPYKK